MFDQQPEHPQTLRPERAVTNHGMRIVASDGTELALFSEFGIEKLSATRHRLSMHVGRVVTVDGEFRHPRLITHIDCRQLAPIDLEIIDSVTVSEALAPDPTDLDGVVLHDSVADADVSDVEAVSVATVYMPWKAPHPATGEQGRATVGDLYRWLGASAPLPSKRPVADGNLGATFECVTTTVHSTTPAPQTLTDAVAVDDAHKMQRKSDAKTE